MIIRILPPIRVKVDSPGSTWHRQDGEAVYVDTNQRKYRYGVRLADGAVINFRSCELMVEKIGGWRAGD